MDIYLTSSIRKEELVRKLSEMGGQDPPIPSKTESESQAESIDQRRAQGKINPAMAQLPLGSGNNKNQPIK
ncbi:hypothetical protein [Dyadobacter sp. OTU695]|uniref:hypothetical protein n=1 Tax=Dyadobacter sp. OTU695 TaxID=3043860 RepID=UPI00313C8A34